jgi:predicted nucleotidyltransferase
MSSEMTYNAIKQAIHAYLPDARILLFGSHAKGVYDINSDYDLLIITPNLLTRKEKLTTSSQMHRAIVRAIHAPIDLLLYSEEEVAKKKELPGHIVQAAMKEGIAL